MDDKQRRELTRNSSRHEIRPPRPHRLCRLRLLRLGLPQRREVEHEREVGGVNDAEVEGTFDREGVDGLSEAVHVDWARRAGPGHCDG